MRAIYLALALIASLFVGVSTANAQVAYRGDFETGDFSQWWFVQAAGQPVGCGGPCTIDNVGNTTAMIITSPHKQGKYAMKCVVRSTGGGASSNNRCETNADENQIGGLPGQSWWYGWWTYFPGPSQTWWSLGGDWNDTFQFFDRSNQSAFIIGGIDATSGHPTLYDDGPFGHTTLADSLRYNHWYHFVVHAVWSLNPAVGLWQLNMDGKVKNPATHMVTMGQSSDPRITFSFGFYSARDTDNTVVDDDFCRASTQKLAASC